MTSWIALYLDRYRQRLSWRLMAAFAATMAVVALVVTGVGLGIVATTIETRAESRLATAQAVVELHLRELAEEMIFLNQLLASSQMLTEEMAAPSSSRALQIALMSEVRHRGMQARVYQRRQSEDQPYVPVVEGGFLGMRTIALTPLPNTRELTVVSVAPIETEEGVQRVISLQLPLTAAYLDSMAAGIGADITMVLPNQEATSTLPASDIGVLIHAMRSAAQRFGKAASVPWTFSSGAGGKATAALVSQFPTDLGDEGVIIISMPMSELRAAKMEMIGIVLLIAFALLAGASLLYLSLIRLVTRRVADVAVARK